jgi:predicted nucleic acid-binding protein
MAVCLDSWAVLHWLEGVEPSARRVERAINDGAIMSWVNVGEVVYVVTRKAGDAAAQEVTRDLRRRLTLEVPTPERFLDAARLKAQHRLAYPDAIAIATAKANRADLLTGNPDLLRSDSSWETIDLRTRRGTRRER